MRRPITPSLYALLLSAYRERPGNMSYALNHAKCGRDMAKRAWFKGWTNQFTWARCIKDVLAEEQQQARAELLRLEAASRQARLTEQQQERDDSKREASQTLAQEGQMLRAGRAGVIKTLAAALTMLPAVMKAGEVIRDSITKPGATPLKVGEASRFLRDNAQIYRYLVQATQTLVETERTSKGEPSKIIGLELDGAAMSPEEAFREIEEINELYQLARRRNLVSVAVGSAPPPPPAQDPDPETTH